MTKPASLPQPEPFSWARNTAFLVHPLLFGIGPVLFVFANNTEHGIFFDFWRPAAAILGTAFLVLMVFWAVFRDRDRAAVLTSVLFLLFFSFGPAYDRLGGRSWGPFDFKDPRDLGIACGAVWAAVTAASFLFKKQLPTVTRFLNMAALSWAGMSLITIVYGAVQKPAPGVPAGTSDTALVEKIRAAPRKPDVYYFIIDTYGRGDTLKGVFGYDNAWFLEGLREMGFYVAERANTNYSFTALSLGSSLNMDYYGEEQKALLRSGKEACYRLLGEAIHRNRVMSAFKQGGYTTVAFGTIYSEETIREADIFFEYEQGRSEFYEIVFAMTPLRWMSVPGALAPAEALRRRTLYQFRKVPEVARMSAPTFTFVHFVPPRDPFVFGKNGEPIDKGEARFLLSRALRPEYVSLYSGEVHFMSQKILGMVREILKKSKEPPIIIIQADHGPAYNLVDWDRPSGEIVRQRMGILSAYYLPGGGEKRLYETISPVNSFRSVFDHCFGADLPLLEDRHYFSAGTCSALKDVTDLVVSGAVPSAKR